MAACTWPGPWTLTTRCPPTTFAGTPRGRRPPPSGAPPAAAVDAGCMAGAWPRRHCRLEAAGGSERPPPVAAAAPARLQNCMPGRCVSPSCPPALDLAPRRSSQNGFEARLPAPGLAYLAAPSNLAGGAGAPLCLVFFRARLRAAQQSGACALARAARAQLSLTRQPQACGSGGGRGARGGAGTPPPALPCAAHAAAAAAPVMMRPHALQARWRWGTIGKGWPAPPIPTLACTPFLRRCRPCRHVRKSGARCKRGAGQRRRGDHGPPHPPRPLAHPLNSHAGGGGAQRARPGGERHRDDPPLGGRRRGRPAERLDRHQRWALSVNQQFVVVDYGFVFETPRTNVGSTVKRVRRAAFSCRWRVCFLVSARQARRTPGRAGINGAWWAGGTWLVGWAGRHARTRAAGASAPGCWDRAARCSGLWLPCGPACDM